MGQPDKTVQYVRDAVGKHIESGMLEDWESDALAIDGWLGDCPQDLITHATAKVLGTERLDKLVARLDARPWSEALDVSDEVSELRLELASHRRKLERVSRLVAGSSRSEEEA